MRALLILVLLASSALGQVRSTAETRFVLSGIDGYQVVADQVLVPKGSKPVQTAIGSLTVDSKASMIRVTASTANREPVPVKKVSANTFFVYGKGKVWIDLLCIDFELKIFENEQFAIDIGDSPTPVPPQPDPTPTPTPDPTVPIKEPGLRILMIYETRDVNRPSVQNTILFSTVIQEYARTHCVAVGRTPEFRRFDKDTVMTGESKIWQEAMARPRTMLPWLIVSNGKAGYEGPLPSTLADTLTLLKKYGGE